MATPEQIVQIETALRGRFFQYVPKVEMRGRENWTEDQHDLDRFSRALAGYALVGLCGVDDAVAAGSITDGKDDRGIDSLYFDRARNRLLLVQSKFKRNGGSPSQAENLKTINGIRAIQSRQFDGFNQAFQNRLDEIEEALDTPGVPMEVVLCFLGELQNLSPHVITDLDNLQAEMNRLTDRMFWRAVGRSDIHSWLISEQTPTTVNANVTLGNWAGVTAPRKAIYGQISAAALVDLVVSNGTALFQRNLRHYLGSIGVNVAIEETVLSQPGDFFYLNNGITAVAERITQAVGNPDQCVFGLTNVSIVNGAQTAGAIANAALSGEISPDAKVFITVIEIGAQVDDIGLRITRARNYQNVVRGIDFAALDPEQERLRQELALVGITYYYRPSAEARTRRDDAVTLEEAVVAMACLSFPVLSSNDIARLRGPNHAVDFVVTAKNEVGRLWDQGGSYYVRLFDNRTSGLSICRLVQIFRFIDQILAATERSENGYHRRMFFRHGRFFIMAFVAHQSADVIGRAEPTLSLADKTLLSQRTNELAEMVYAESRSLQAIKGYLSIFRNLTDSQTLADSVLRRLAERHARQQAAIGIPRLEPQEQSGR
jgi:hypothetical protein